MKTVHQDQIVTGERQRDVIPTDSLVQLASGIQKVGLLHAIVLKDDGVTLIAGERRYRALCFLYNIGVKIKHDGVELGLGEIPYTTLGECDEILAQEAELLENALRLDLTWQQKDRAILKIKTMCELKAGGNPVDSKAVAAAMLKAQGVEDPKQSKVRNTANKVEQAELRTQYSDDVRVQKAKTVAEADRIIKKDMEAKHREKLAEQFKDIETPHVIEQGDCCELVKGLADGCVDVICADPIYGINANEMHMFQRVDYNEGSHHQYDDSWQNWDKMFNIMPAELYRVAKKEAACYLFCDINRFFDFDITEKESGVVMRVKGLASRMADAGWTVWARPIIWYKGNIGSLPKPEHGPRYTHEYVLYCYKGERKTTGVFHDVITVQQTTGHVHAAGKPSAVYYELLRRSAMPGNTILDFNAGSFPILPAANALCCKAIAWELDGKWMKEAALNKTSVFKPE